MNKSPIGIFDSGSGGLTVLDACRTLLPYENYVYVSDSRAGGWGSLSEDEIAQRVDTCVHKLLSYECKAIVAACNTATATRITVLRHDCPLPFIGVEPAVRPAVRAFPDGKIVTLCTPATAKQEKFRALVADCGGNIVVSPQPALAQKIERNLHALDCLQREAEEIVATEQPDALVLGCTHYVFIRHLFADIVGDARVFDGNAGVARRLQAVLCDRGICADGRKTGGVYFDAV
ncbi:MAG: aspartate/glutamate racemase family protein [Clostridiales bacterium]|nr:aspartate/glutamate racemase family protein [Clostridiales bacterium]